jgi:hypothetical protein
MVVALQFPRQTTALKINPYIVQQAVGSDSTALNTILILPHVFARCHNRNRLCYHFLTLRRGVRAVYGDGLENRSSPCD